MLYQSSMDCTETTANKFRAAPTLRPSPKLYKAIRYTWNPVSFVCGLDWPLRKTVIKYGGRAQVGSPHGLTECERVLKLAFMFQRYFAHIGGD